MSRLVPVVIALVAIAALTVVEGSISGRWSDLNRSALYCATLLDRVPQQIGDWEGVEVETDNTTLEVAGAEGFISRSYRNTKTGQQVGVWLIVGHARDTAEHTPDICYPASGFEQCQSNAKFAITLPNGKEANFWTAMFKKRNSIGAEVAERVFWTWFKPNLRGGEATEISWVSPDNARFHFGSTKALYKLYFTSVGDAPEASPEESVCLEFAGLFMTEANPILQKANEPVPDSFNAEAVNTESTEAGAA